MRMILHEFGFHPKIVNWIMECTTSVSFSMSVNGNIHGYFKGKRGLRQGDPISPYLFTLVMEVLSLLMQRAVHVNQGFKFHNLCEKQRLINLCFADDLFLFARGEVWTCRVIMDVLEEFKKCPGLVPSIAKSTVFLCNICSYCDKTRYP